jgi:predicted Fe-Mo cluster-binding NifX family protein
MKFAVPIADGKLTQHFGHCKEFAFVEETNGQISATTFKEPPPHEPGVLPRWLHEQGVNVVIAGGMGQRAITLFNEAGIKVVTGAPPLSPDILAKQYLEKSLESGPNACDH